LFISFTGDTCGSAREVNIANIEPDKFRDTYSRGIEEFQHGTISQEVNLIGRHRIAHELTGGSG